MLGEKNFQAAIAGKFAPLLIYNNDIAMVSVVETAINILEMTRPEKKPWITTHILEICVERRNVHKIRGRST